MKRHHEHEEPLNVKKTKKRCEEDGCMKAKIFGFPEQQSSHCGTHRKNGMIDRVTQRCLECDSLKPCFGFTGERGLYCIKHKKPNMVNVRHKDICQELGCTTRANFGKKGERATRCSKHKLDGMTDLNNKTCEFDGCNSKNPHFGMPNDKRGLLCAIHKHEGMIDLMKELCIYDQCTIKPSFGNLGEKPRYCTKHKLDGMVQLVANICLEHGVRAGFGFTGCRPTHCAQCVQPNMVSDPKRRCEHKDCKKFAQYGTHGSTHERCEDHKTDTDVDKVRHRCAVCNNPKQVDKDGICSDCGSRYLNYILCKQRRVKGYIDSNPDIPRYVYYDQVVDARCGRERPDFVWDCGTHMVILEVDEDQHKRYEEGCDHARMVNITESFQLPCIWIRYNPDSFRGANSTIRETDRLNFMKKVLMVCLDLCPHSANDVLRVVKLFFDGFEGTHMNVHELIRSVNY